jgi:hypothetical protein
MAGGTQRRLAAIVSADVVGYSRLMGADETGTLDALRAHRAELIDPLIAETGGRIRAERYDRGLDDIFALSGGAPQFLTPAKHLLERQCSPRKT